MVFTSFLIARLSTAAVLDLRDWSLARGTEANAEQNPLELNRAAKRLTILLPLGNGEGNYQVRIVSSSDKPGGTIDADAKLKGGVTSFQIGVSLSSSPPGRYVLQIRKVGLTWNSYPIVLR